MMKFCFYFSCILLVGCSSSSRYLVSKNNKDLLLDSINFWYQKDYTQDGIPGISLEKWYEENKKKPTGNIIVAVVDTQIDTNHEDLQGQLWANTKEIPNNKIDDDNNGYIDDVNGWNFLGTKSGNYTVWANFEFTRIVREWSKRFKNINLDSIDYKDLADYNEYLSSEKTLNEKNKYFKNWLNSFNFNIKMFPKTKDTLKYFFPKGNYSLNQLDSLKKIYKHNDKDYYQCRDDNDSDLGSLLLYMKFNIITNNSTLEKLTDSKCQYDSIVNKNLNTNYNERLYIGEHTDSLEKGYGNNKINAKIIGIRSFNNHDTEVSGVIASKRKNKIGCKGFSDNIKIMPLTISVSGDEHDKDIAMAIYYAVDNGAKIINMSFSKEFSLHKKWVFNALEYAEKHNVLIVNCASNDSSNRDENKFYPNDTDYNSENEVANNFIVVGSISKNKDSTFVSNFSNYGKKNVDLFAPGEDIYTTFPDNKYDFDSGTSLAAPMVSGTAALLWLYYPKLSVHEVKQIILESGTSYDIEVLVPGGKGKKVAFKELSKSGKVLNVYNAMKMAKEMSKLKN